MRVHLVHLLPKQLVLLHLLLQQALLLVDMLWIVRMECVAELLMSLLPFLFFLRTFEIATIRISCRRGMGAWSGPRAGGRRCWSALKEERLTRVVRERWRSRCGANHVCCCDRACAAAGATNLARKPGGSRPGAGSVRHKDATAMHRVLCAVPDCKVKDRRITNKNRARAKSILPYLSTLGGPEEAAAAPAEGR